MKRRWTLTKLIAAGSLAAMNLVLAILMAVVSAFVGVPLIGGFINMAVLIITLLVIDQFGAAAIYMTILGILLLPLPISGIPGFVPKVALLGLGGLLADTIYLFLKKRKFLASMVVGGIEVPIAWILLLRVGRLFGMSGLEHFEKIFHTKIGITGAVVAGSTGGALGYLIYYKIKDSAVIRRIQQ